MGRPTFPSGPSRLPMVAVAWLLQGSRRPRRTALSSTGLNHPEPGPLRGWAGNTGSKVLRRGCQATGSTWVPCGGPRSPQRRPEVTTRIPILGRLQAAGTRMGCCCSILSASPPTTVQTWGRPLAVAQAPVSSSTRLMLDSRPQCHPTWWDLSDRLQDGGPGRGGVGTPCLPSVLPPEAWG